MGTPELWRPERTACGRYMPLLALLSPPWSLFRRLLRRLPLSEAPTEAEGEVAVGGAARSVAGAVSGRRRRLRPINRQRPAATLQPPTPHRRLWRAYLLVCVSTTGTLLTRPPGVRALAVGETSRPGTPQRRRPWAFGSRGGPDNKAAFPCGHWSQFFHFSSSILCSSSRSCPVWSCRSTHPLLG
jgi:hypothetical protein